MASRLRSTQKLMGGAGLTLALLVLIFFEPSRALGFDAAPGGPRAEAFLLFRLINEARVAPKKTLEQLGIDVEEARRAMGDDAWVLDVSLPPLSWKPALFEAAERHGLDMIDGVFYDHRGRDGSLVADRVQDVGYEAVLVEELLGLLSVLTFVDGPEAAWILFEQWVRDEVSPSRPFGGLVLFNPLLTQIGVSLQPAAVVLDGGSPVNVYVAVAVVARPTQKEPMVVGNLLSQDGLWGLDGGQPGGAWVVVCRDAHERTLWTGPADPWGGYQCPLPEGYAVVEVVDPAVPTTVLRVVLRGIDENLWADIVLP